MKKSITLALVFISILMACAPKVGPKGDRGDAGNDGINGSIGSTGPTGSVGATGPSGSDGQDATPVTVVKLCPETPSYPSVFVEYAVCTGGNLYAVYNPSSGRDFFTLLPPGNYNSVAVGSICSFTVLSNCVVQQ